MVKRTSTRLVAYLDDKSRVLLNLSSAPGASLFISIRSGDLQRAGDEPNAPKFRVISEKLSVHLTEESRFQENVIHFRTEFDGALDREEFLHTTAIKEHNQFIMVFTKRYGDLRKTIFDETGDPKSIMSIGVVDYGFDIVLSVVVGPKDRPFVLPGYLSHVNVDQWVGDEFRVVFIWNFIHIMHDGSWRKVMNISVPREIWQDSEVHRAVDSYIAGDDEQGCIDKHILWSQLLLAEEVNKIAERADRGIISQHNGLLLMCDVWLFKTGRRRSFDYCEWFLGKRKEIIQLALERQRSAARQDAVDRPEA